MPGPYVSTTPTTESPEAKAIRLLNRQLGELQILRGLNYKNPAFKAWRDTTSSILDMFLGPDSHHTARFRETRFLSNTLEPFDGDDDFSQAISMNDRMTFRAGCDMADASLRAAIKHVEDFGVYVEEPKSAQSGRGRGKGGVSQNFHGPVNLNQAIATGSAVQRIGHVGNKIGVDLKEISNLLQQSQDLSPNQVRQGIGGVEGLAVEVEKPEEKRNWKAVLEYGQRVLELAGKAVDLGTKIAPYTSAVAELVEKAKHAL